MQQPPADPNQPPQPSAYPQPDAHLAGVPTEHLGAPAYAAAAAAAATMPLHPVDPIEQMVRQQENRNKAISLGISMGAVGLLLATLAWWTLANFQAEEIELVVAATQSSATATVEKKQFQQSVSQKPSRPSSSPSNIISAAKTSPISVPSIDTNIASPDLGSSFGGGFGGGGFGDGLGGGMGVPSVMKGRCDTADRLSRLRKAGGKAALDRAVLKALRWIKDQQKEDGSFGQQYPVAMTSFALLAFSGHCETVDSPEFGEAVKKSIEYLIDVADKGKGYLSSTGTVYAQVSYEHGIAVYSLAEAYSMNKNARAPFKRISPTLKKSVPIIIEGQTTGGGWLYSYANNGTGDLSVAGWNIQALKAAELTGLKFPGLAAAKLKAVRYLTAAEDPNGSDGYYRYRIRDGDKGKLSLTGVGILCARMLDAPSELEDKALKLILSKAPKSAKLGDIYAWYYHSQAAFQVQGKHWRNYNDTYQKVIAETQEKDGSWPGTEGHGPKGAEAKFYATTLCTLMLEVYYRYLPTTK